MKPETMDMLLTINSIIEDYQNQGYKLTLRQLYYQLVSRDIIRNNLKEYAKISRLLTDGRMCGIVDWDAIEDRLRRPSKPSSWETPGDILDSCIYSYQLPRMQDQPIYLEVWVEKDALSGVLKRVTEKYHIPIVVNRGYSSASAMYDAYNRFKYQDDIKILYLGDFDPSGIDMIRDIRDRSLEFLGDRVNHFEVIPVALTRAQIDKYKPPPNPAKMTDPRAGDYVDKHGSTSWEVDALKPEILNSTLTKIIEKYIDVDLYNSIVAREKADITKLKTLHKFL
jgi:hypothetical protein